MTPVANLIQRSKAVLVLIIFGLSLVPRQVIHNFVTSHKHIRYSEFSGKAQVSTETFSCKADTVFLQQSFDAIEPCVQFFCARPVVSHSAFFREANNSPKPFQQNLRGPPADSFL